MDKSVYPIKYNDKLSISIVDGVADYSIIDSPLLAVLSQVSVLSSYFHIGDQDVIFFDRISDIKGIIGSKYNDHLSGNDLDNVFRGGPGRDVIDGQGCIDTADYSDKSSPVAVSLDGPRQVEVLVGGVPEDIISNIENIVGGSGNDRLIGDSGANSFRGGPGQDYIDGGEFLDRADYSDKAASVRVTLDGEREVTVYVGGEAEDTIRNIEQILGGSGDDYLVGDDTNNAFQGGDGRDFIDGRGGMDIIDYTEKVQSVVVRLAENGVESVVLVGGVPEDTVKNIEIVAGGSGDDHLVGNSDRNWLSGGSGDDILQGGGNGDLLIGEEGADTFVYVSVEESKPEFPDYILDFNSEEGDRIDLSAVDGDRLTDGFQSLRFGSTLPHPNGVWYEVSGNTNELGGMISGRDIMVYADVDGDALADMAIHVCEAAPEGPPNLVLSDSSYFLA